MKYALSIFLIINLTLHGCKGQASDHDPTTSETVTRRDLFNSLRSAGKILLVYHSDKPEQAKEYIRIFSGMNIGRTPLVPIVKHVSEVTSEEWHTFPLFLVGNFLTGKSNSELIEKLPIKLRKDGFEFASQKFDDRHTLMVSFYPNPLNPKLPLTFMTGAEEENILALLGGLGSFWRWRSWGYQVYRDNDRIVLGDFSQHPENSWQVDGEVHFDFSRDQQKIVATDHYEFYSYQQDVESIVALGSFSQKCEEKLSEISQFIGGDVNGLKLKYFTYASAEEKGLITSNTDQSHLKLNDQSIHTVVNEIYKDNYLAKENELILRHLLGKPKLDAMEKGLAIYFADQWQVKGYQHWALKLYRSDNMLPLQDLLDNELFSKESNLVTGALAASWVAFLIEYRGKVQFLTDYSEWLPQKQEILQLQQAWYKYLGGQAEAHPDQPREKTPLSNFNQGFNFTHEGYQIYNGYLSKQAGQSLQLLSDKQSNTVALVPYSGMSDPHKPTFLSFNRSAGGENDESVIYSAYQAKKLGMTVMLKPHVWIRGEWPGAVSMTSEADWKAFFDYYYRWIRHYALLAEIHELDLFSVGVEFAQATLKREDDWRKIIKKVRKLYSGHLTYAANWGEEFENVGFWDQLDYIGLNCYYPLTANSNPSDKELKENFKKVLKKAKKISQAYDKPLLFTEIGFRSVDGPWLNPHEEAQDRAYNQDHQAKCYQIVFECIQNEDWIQGIYWWKWPTNLRDIRENDRRFVPYTKTAEVVVDEWFEKYSGY